MSYSRLSLPVLALVCAPVVAMAQGTPPAPVAPPPPPPPPPSAAAQTAVPDSATYAKAVAMVSGGNAAAGREMMDSLLRATPVSSRLYAEALYQHAATDASASDAENDYRRIVVGYSLSPRVEESLLRLAQLEAARGDRDAALLHLARLAREYPAGASRARASYLTARVLFDKNDIAGACAANADALARVRPSDVELKNQIGFQNGRCVGAAAVASAVPAPAPEPNATAASAVSDSAPAIADTATPATRAGTAKTTVNKVRSRASAKPATKAAPRGGYTVQVAAFTSRADADAMAAKLRGRGYTSARVFGSAAPFRVRIGHFNTRLAALAELGRLRAKKINGFVTEG